MKVPAGHSAQVLSPIWVEWLPGEHRVLRRPSHAWPMGQRRQQSSTVHGETISSKYWPRTHGDDVASTRPTAIQTLSEGHTLQVVCLVSS